MSHDKLREKTRWRQEILLTIYFLWLSGLFVVSVLRDIYADRPLFNHNWGLVLIGISVLAGEAVVASRRESPGGTRRSNQSVTMGLIAIGLFIVAPDIVLKVHFGILALLAIVTTTTIWINGIHKGYS